MLSDEELAALPGFAQRFYAQQTRLWPEQVADLCEILARRTLALREAQSALNYLFYDRTSPLGTKVEDVVNERTAQIVLSALGKARKALEDEDA